MNLAHNCVDRWAERTPDAIAVVWEGEEGAVRRVTYRELRELADRLANGLGRSGSATGDAVGIFLPMSPETVAAAWPARSSGRSGCRSSRGTAPTRWPTRLNDAGAKVLITADGFPREASSYR